MKQAKIIMAVALSLSLTACNLPSGSKKSDVKMKDGTYTSVQEGHNGSVKVETTISENKITDVKVLENSETEGLATPALTQVPDQIVEYQTVQPDVVSGATYTTVAITAAVKDAVKQAGGDPDAFKNDIPNQEKGKKESLETDVVVVGGGGAGMVATSRLEQLGKKVIVVEKTSSLGGTIRVSGGNQVVQGSEAQKKLGVIDDSADSMKEDFLKNGGNLNDTELLDIYSANVGQTTDWLMSDLHVSYNEEAGLHKLAEYRKNRELAYQGGGLGVAKVLAQAVEDSGAQVLLNTTVKELIVENGTVVGVKAVTNLGKEYTIKAKQVVLASGGYGNNAELLPAIAKEGLFYGLDSSMGEGLEMAKRDVNANTTHMEYIKEYPNGVETSPKHAKSTIAGNIPILSSNGILVNQDGKRVVNEKASNHDILNVLQQQKNQTLYLVMDSASFAVWKTKLKNAGLTEETIDQYVANNGSSEPIFTSGKTLEEAAKAAKIDGKALQETVDKFNGYVAAGVDEDFQRNPDYLKTPIGDGPYYIVEQKARYASTMGGLDVNNNLQVMNKDGNPIAGLYAAGEIIGGVMGSDSPSGANNGWAVTSGKYVAEKIAEQQK